MTTFSIVISFFVSVPVLSEQITDAEPSVSTEDSFFTIARSCAIRCTPSASTTDSTAGSPSGTAATASDTPTSSTETRSDADRRSAVSRIAPTTTAAITITAIPSMRPIRSTSRCSGVACASVRPSRRATVPISVAIAVAVTTARPRPRTTAVPLNTMFTRSPSPTGSAIEPIVLQHRLALPSQRRLRDRQRRRLDQPGVGRDRVALGERQDVARHHLGGRNPLLAPIAHDPGRRRRHPLQRRDRLLGTRLLHVTEHGIGDDDRRDHDRVVRRRLAPLERPRDERDDDGREQQIDQRVGELAEELPPRRHALGRLEPVRPEARQPRGRLRRAQPPSGVRAQGRRDHACLDPPGLP